MPDKHVRNYYIQHQTVFYKNSGLLDVEFFSKPTDVLSHFRKLYGL